jgi:hypothetical protein
MDAAGFIDTLTRAIAGRGAGYVDYHSMMIEGGKQVTADPAEDTAIKRLFFTGIHSGSMYARGSSPAGFFVSGSGM